jgi:Glycosyltransferase family 87
MRTRWRRRGVGACARAALGVACYVAVLVALLAIGRSVTLPDQAYGNPPVSGAVNAALHELLGKAPPTDFLIDYASVAALWRGDDAYAISQGLVEAVGFPWEVLSANPHPPTILTLQLPFIALGYPEALAAWALLMVVLMVATLRLVGVPMHLAVAGGIALSFTFPGAYGLVNPVPVIGFGAAVAWRWRDSPLIAGAGLVLAAAPKLLGVALVLPFLLAGRWRAVAWAVGGLVLVAAVPLVFDRGVWSGWYDLGLEGGRANAARADNASLLYLARDWGISLRHAAVMIAVVAAGLAMHRRDLYWPALWAGVAVMPLLWMYSMLTFVPIFARAALRGGRQGQVVAILGAGVLLGSAPYGNWPVWTVPAVTGLAAVALTVPPRAADDAIWFHPRLVRLLPERVQPWFAPGPEPAAPMQAPVSD